MNYAGRGSGTGTFSQDYDPSTVIEHIYDAACDREVWPSALQALATYSDSLCATHFLWRKDDDALGFFIGSPEYTGDDLYRAHYSTLDPRRKLTQRLPSGGILRCHEHLDEEFVAQSEFYQDFSLQHERRFLMSTHLIKTEKVSSFAVLHRTRDQGEFTDRDALLLEQVAPHLRRAAQIQIKLEEAEAARKGADAALDQLAFAVLTVDRDGRVLSSNRMGDEILAASDGLSLRGGCLAVTGGRGAERFCCCIRGATEPPSGKTARQGASVLVTRPSGRSPYRVLIAPLADRASTSFGTGRQRTAVVLISDPDQAILPPEKHLADLFGLTSAEAQVAIGLLGGKKLEEVAEQRMVSLGTIRSQLKSILRKTETDRQADLVRSLLNIPVLRAAR